MQMNDSISIFIYVCSSIAFSLIHYINSLKSVAGEERENPKIKIIPFSSTSDQILRITILCWIENGMYNISRQMKTKISLRYIKC